MRLASKEYYGVGSVFVFDALHLPYGCRFVPVGLLHSPIPPFPKFFQQDCGSKQRRRGRRVLTQLPFASRRILPSFLPALLSLLPALTSDLNSVWPAWWSTGTNWPAGGEIDTFEGVNQQTNNQMALREFVFPFLARRFSPASLSHTHFIHFTSQTPNLAALKRLPSLNRGESRLDIPPRVRSS